ncbi:unnamed protein product [Victoria cruziana]
MKQARNQESNFGFHHTKMPNEFASFFFLVCNQEHGSFHILLSIHAAGSGPQRMPKLHEDKRTSPFIWLIAIICSMIAAAVIIAGVIILFVYVVFKPKVPVLNITYVHLDRLDYSQNQQLGVQMSLVLDAENGNSKAKVTFSDLSMSLNCQGVTIAKLAASRFEVPPNSTNQLRYLVPSSPIPVEDSIAEEIGGELRNNLISFTVDGHARTSWSVGAFHSLRYYTYLSCNLQLFLPAINGSSKLLTCRTKIR